MAKKQKLVLLHGWGANHRVFDDLLPLLKDFELTLLDLPGYGDRVRETSPSSIEEITQRCLDDAPDQAIWLGWSLGGMVAMQSAIWDADRVGNGSSRRVRALCLVNTTPCFTVAEDWHHGISTDGLQSFAQQLTHDYEKTLADFLLLQAGKKANARLVAEKVAERVQQLPMPSESTLLAGIECLDKTDMRQSLDKISAPVQIISGRLDRVIRPQASEYLANMLRAKHIQFNQGHAPFLTQPAEFSQALIDFVSTLDLEQQSGLS